MPKRNIIWLILIFCTAVVTVMVTRWYEAGKNSHMFRDDERLRRVYDLISANYYHDLPTGIHRSNAIKGMINSLDEYSSYIPPERAGEFRKKMSGRIVGSGIRVQLSKDGNLQVLSVLSGSAGGRAGLYPEDRILSVDGQPVSDFEGEKLEELITKIEHSTSREFQLTVLRKIKHEGKLVLQTLKFDVIPEKSATISVEGLFRESSGQWNYSIDSDAGIAYIKVSEFVDSTVSDFQAAFRQPARIRGLILDLRDNPGGSLGQSVGLANLFLGDGVIVTVQDNRGKITRHAAHESGTYPNFPMIVLVNGKTASAAEVVAAALARSNRAIIVGSKTHGKFYVQSIFDLGDELGIINLTTARLFVDDELSDIVELCRPLTADVSVDFVGDIDMLNRTRENIPTSKPADTQPDIQAEATRLDREVRIERILQQDSQLARAVELLNNPKKFEILLSEKKDAPK